MIQRLSVFTGLKQFSSLFSPSTLSQGLVLGLNGNSFRWEEVWGVGLLFAAPMRRTTRSRKRIRNGPRALKVKTNLVKCRTCGNNRLMHHLCPYCFPFIRWISGKDKGLERAKTMNRLMDDQIPKKNN